MFTSVFDYTALVQFVGAFNFAFVYTRFDEYLHKHYINSDLRLEKQFLNIKADIDADIESVDKMSPVTVITKGKTINTENAIKSLRSSYGELGNRHLSIKESLSYKNNFHYRLRNMGALFLILGLYSIVDLFYIGHLNHTNNDENHCVSFIIVNALVSLYVLYFIISEIVYFNTKPNTHPCFQPGYRASVIIMFVICIFAVIAPYVNKAICNYIGVLLGIEECHNWIIWGSLILPVSGFLICIAGVLVLYIASKHMIEAEFSPLVKDYQQLHKKKEQIGKYELIGADPDFG